MEVSIASSSDEVVIFSPGAWIAEDAAPDDDVRPDEDASDDFETCCELAGGRKTEDFFFLFGCELDDFDETEEEEGVPTNSPTFRFNPELFLEDAEEEEDDDPTGFE